MPNDIHTIPESSETESISERYHSPEDSTTLEDLFAELEKETQTYIIDPLKNPLETCLK